MAANPQVACLHAPPRSPGRARVGVPDSAITSFEPCAGHGGRRPRDRRDRPGRVPAFARRHRPVGQPAHDHPAGPQPAHPLTFAVGVDRRAAPSRLADHPGSRAAEGQVEDRHPVDARPAGRGVPEGASIRSDPGRGGAGLHGARRDSDVAPDGRLGSRHGSARQGRRDLLPEELWVRGDDRRGECRRARRLLDHRTAARLLLHPGRRHPVLRHPAARRQHPALRRQRNPRADRRRSDQGPGNPARSVSVAEPLGTLRCKGDEVMNMRISGAALCIGILVTACGTTQTQAGSGDKHYPAVSAGHSQFVQVIDSRSHKVERRLPMGVPSSGWKHLHSIGSTPLVDTDPQTGATLSTLALGHAYRLPYATFTGVPGGLSPNGQWLVIESYDVTGEDLPSASHFLLIETPGLKIRSRIDLAGFFNFDAVSNDGRRLYLIQFVSGKAYYVRWYDLAMGRLDPGVVFDKNDGANAMSGLRLSGVASANGGWL